jgi:hypothetical protein
MKEPENTTATVVTINESPISIKARADDNEMNPSGWSIIAFAPSASIRCVRAHQPKHLDLFIKSILALAGHWQLDYNLTSATYSSSYKATENAIHKITQGKFK